MSHESKLVLGCLITSACDPSAALSELEQAALEELVMNPDDLPPSPTNAVADDPEAVALGRYWFFETRFSGPLKMASDLGAVGDLDRVGCVTCHDLPLGGADRRSASPVSIGAALSSRNAHTVLNVGFMAGDRWISWDGRNDSLWAQAAGSRESGSTHHGTRLKVAHVVFSLYRDDYESVFGPMPDLSDTSRFPPAEGLCDATGCLGKPGDELWDTLSLDDQTAVSRVHVNVAKAVAAYERSLLTPDSPFDKFMRGRGQLSPSAIRGAKLFVGRASCNECHLGPILTDGKFHNLGAPQGVDIDGGRTEGIEAVLGNQYNAASEWSDDREAPHLDGLVAGPEDYVAFKTPTLRNVELTAPYMHNGAIGTLWDVLEFYRFGGRTDGLGEPDVAVQPLELSDRDIHDLIAFLKSLTALPPEDLISPPVLP
jgi:cytochrome c peroxidase